MGKLYFYVIVISFMIVKISYAGEINESKLTIGFGFEYAPEYEIGKNIISPKLYANYQNENGLFVSTERGLGYLYNGDNLNGSIALNYAGKRDDKFESNYAGMGQIKASTVLNLNTGISLLNFTYVSLGAELKLNNREHGNAYRIGLATPVYSNEHDHVVIDIAARFIDAKYAKTYYGVNTEQSIATSYPVYHPTAGIDNVGIKISWEHSFGQHWRTYSVVGVKHLFTNAADSPLAITKIRPSATVMLNYQF
jgi:MipA family protein